MLHKTVHKLRDALFLRQAQDRFLALLIPVMLLTAACGSSATPASYESSPEPSASAPTLSPLELAEPALSGSTALRLSKGQRLRFERISIEQGLSQSTVFCMLQDSQGYMWFGTEDGLNKYDGYNFTVYKHDSENPNGLSDNWITSIYEDRSGVIWIGTWHGGLLRFARDSETFTPFQNDPQTPNSLSHNEVTAIYEDQAGVLWIGTRHGLNRFDRENGRFVQYQRNPNDPHSLSSNAVSSIYQDREGVLWIGTEGGGLDRYDQENEAFVQYQNDSGDPHSLNDNNVRVIYQDLSGILWIGTDGGLSRFDRENDGFIHYQHDSDDPESLSSNQVRSIYQDREGVLWIGTWGGGLDSLDRETETFIHFRHDPGDPHSMSNDIIASIYQDREGVLWVGTVAGGVNKLDIGWRNFGLYQNDPNDPNSLGSDLIRTFYEDRSGTLWIGTSTTGLDRFDRATGRWHHYEHDPDDPDSLIDNWVSCLYQDQSGVLWVGTNNGLDSFDPATDVAIGDGTFTHYQSDSTSSDEKTIRAILQDRSGILWIGTRSGGLNRFDPESGHWRNYRHDPNDPESLSDNWVLSIYQDRSGVLWVGTGGGLDRFDGESDEFIHYRADPNDAQSLVHNYVITVYENREGVLWIGTGDGLDRFDRARETFDHYRIKDGLPNNVIYGILEDEQGYLWLSTNEGLSKFDPRSEIFKNYDVTDGLQGNEFNSGAYYKSSSGEMFFGGIAGFNAFYPDRVKDNPTIPPVVLTMLTQDGEDLDVGGARDSIAQITLRWPDNSFEFEFAALSYAHSEKNQYAYKLEGVDDDWVYIGTRRYGRYTNLSGGTYTLRLKGSNNDGVWNETGASVTITVVPPFWATWWFRAIVLLVLAGGAFGGYRLRVQSLEARGRELESQVDDRTKEMAALNAVAAVVSRSLNLQEILSRALNKTLEVVGVEAGGIYLLREDTQVLIIAAHKGLSAQFVAEIDNLEVGEGFSGRVVQTGEPLVVRDLSTDPRLTRSVARESGFHSLAIAPLLSRATVLGTLFVVTHGRREFSQQEVELLTAIGAQIGVAVENARLYEQAQQVAVVQERQRLARELHDSVTQSLHSSTLMAEAGRRLASAGDLERTRHYLARLGEISQQALKEMRLLVYELRPPALREVGLVGALQQRLDAVERRAGIDARLVVSGDPGGGKEVELPAAVEETLYRIAQEALNNALKHSQPSSVTVTLRIEGPLADRRVEIEIVDDGSGFDAGAVDGAGGMGLVSMRERAEKVGGTLTIRSAPGKGTRIKVIVG